MNYKNILGISLIVFSSFALQTASAKTALDVNRTFAFDVKSLFDASKGLPSPTPPNYLAPIRQAKGTAQVIRTVMSFDPVTGMPIIKQDIACSMSLTVNVFDARTIPDASINVSMTECQDTYNGDVINIGIASMVVFSNRSLLGQPPQDIKSFISFSYANFKNSGQSLPKTPFQTSFTKDLDQIYFGSITTPDQYVSCSYEHSEPSQPISPSPLNKDNTATKCTVINPVAYQVIWEVEDRP